MWPAAVREFEVRRESLIVGALRDYCKGFGFYSERFVNRGRLLCGRTTAVNCAFQLLI